MAFNFNNQFAQWEVPKNGTKTFQFFPFLDGVGNAEIGTAPTITAYDQSNNVLSTPTATIVALSTGSRIDFTVSVGAIDYGDKYRVDITWSPSGSSATNNERIPFSVVRTEWGRSSIDANSLITAHTPISGTLANFAEQQGMKINETASQYGTLAHAEIFNMLNNRITAEGEIYARLILDKKLIHLIELFYTLHLVLMNDSSGDPESNSARLSQLYYDKAMGLFHTLGNLAYDSDENGDEDMKVSGFGYRLKRRVF